MSEAQGDAGPPGPFARASQLLQGQVARGMEALPEAARLLRPLAPELASVIASSAVAAHADAYPRCDAEAQHQQKLLREATLANVCLLLAGVLSGLVLAGPTLQGRLGHPSPSRSPWAWVLQLWRWAPWRRCSATRRARAIGCAAGSPCAARPRWHGWTLSGRSPRAPRPRARLPPPPGWRWSATTCSTAARLADRRGEAASPLVGTHQPLGVLATALAFVGGSGAVIASYEPDQSWLPLAGVIGAAFAAYALSREGLRRDRANADRYEKSAVALDQLAAKIDPVAAEIEAGKPAALPAFVDAVTAQLEAEHKQWLDGVTQADLHWQRWTRGSRN